MTMSEKWYPTAAGESAIGVVEPPPARTGVATASTHHGEILQGMFEDADGRLHRGLLTMPCDLYRTRATYTPVNLPSVVVRQTDKVKARRAAEETLAVLGWPCTGGYLDLRGEVPASRGFGSSTSDVLAAIRAVADAFGCALPDWLVAQLAVRAETASDSLMFGDNTVLFAQREGIVLEDFGRRLPRLAAVGFGTSSTGSGVDTLALRPADYGPWEIARFRELRAQLRVALAAGDAAGLGAVATASAEINQRHLPVPGFDRITALVRRTGAVGLQTAHSGDIASLLFDAAQPDHRRRCELARRLLAGIGVDDVWLFTTGG
ncbi:kinase [Actinokineospora cianjurensis]|uniref:Threonine kinase n=1 Tax=Actinokineospora cianjurensis TaxID=585224 RepID=A0A421B3G2_9PSEU|nr:kinase [Actinokineospora cianjurensis]RLK58818.1 threonine kinase [Actinokineospora cianjurensis]